MRRRSNIVWFSWNFNKCLEIWASAQLEPIFGSSSSRFKYFKLGFKRMIKNMTIVWYMTYEIWYLKYDNRQRLKVVPLKLKKTPSALTLRWWLLCAHTTQVETQTSKQQQIMVVQGQNIECVLYRIGLIRIGRLIVQNTVVH